MPCSRLRVAPCPSRLLLERVWTSLRFYYASVALTQIGFGAAWFHLGELSTVHFLALRISKALLPLLLIALAFAKARRQALRVCIVKKLTRRQAQRQKMTALRLKHAEIQRQSTAAAKLSHEVQRGRWVITGSAGSIVGAPGASATSGDGSSSSQGGGSKTPLVQRHEHEAHWTAAHSVAALVGRKRTSVQQTLERGKSAFRAVPFSKLSLADFQTNRDTGLHAHTASARLGAVDAFLSHSWSDSVEHKWQSLCKWGSEHRQHLEPHEQQQGPESAGSSVKGQSRRAPEGGDLMVWLDKVRGSSESQLRVNTHSVRGCSLCCAARLFDALVR